MESKQTIVCQTAYDTGAMQAGKSLMRGKNRLNGKVVGFEFKPATTMDSLQLSGNSKNPSNKEIESAPIVSPNDSKALPAS